MPPFRCRCHTSAIYARAAALLTRALLAILHEYGFDHLRYFYATPYDRINGGHTQVQACVKRAKDTKIFDARARFMLPLLRLRYAAYAAELPLIFAMILIAASAAIQMFSCHYAAMLRYFRHDYFRLMMPFSPCFMPLPLFAAAFIDADFR